MAGTKSVDDVAVQNLLATFIQFPLNPTIVHMAVDVRRTTRLKLPDAIILATARVEGRVLLTRNTRDFQAEEGKIIIPYRL